MNLKKLPLFLLFAFLSTLGFSQPYALSIHTKYDDDFAEWQIFVEDSNGDEQEGSLDMRWKFKEDWTQWDFRIGEQSGSIEMRFRNDPTHWEIRQGGKVVTAKQLWSNDPREWRITDNTTSFRLEARFGTRLNEWVVSNPDHGDFRLFTQYEDDPRDWIIEDDFYEHVSLNFKMAVIFISILHKSPLRN